MARGYERIRTRGNRDGACNICGDIGRLTQDHVPPKGVPRIGQFEMYRLHEAMGNQVPAYRGRLFQGGPTHTTICARCNNERLGGEYDPALISLANDVHRCLTAVTALPRFVHFPCVPQRIARAVVGHLLAVGVNMPAAGEIGAALAGYFLDPAAEWPAELEFSAWVYPYSRQVSIRGAMMMKLGLLGNVHFSLLKFYPLAFLITRGDISAGGPSIQRMLEGTRQLDDLGHFSVELGSFTHFAWPESPEDDGMILMGEGAVVALPKSPFEPRR